MPRRVLLIQLPIPPLGPEPIRGNVPLAAGYLKLHAELAGLERSYDIRILPAADANRLGDRAMVEAILSHDPWMIGFTCYLWNIDRTLWIAETLKRRRRDMIIVLGGPEITRDNDWMLSSEGYDYAVVGEGEQTFTELLTSLETTPIPSRPIAGLVARGADPRVVPARVPMPRLDDISSPYLYGILDAGDQDHLLLETIRGCVFECKFCYYPKAYDKLYYVSEQKIVANLEHARRRGACEVFLLDPTLNQRRDFTAFLELLREANRDGFHEFHAELRAEGLKPEHARLMREANFKEVEIGLQSIDVETQRLMSRPNNLRAFETGVKALMEEGVNVKVDLIVGLPGDTVDSIRRGMHYLAEKKLYGDMQVFHLSILPGTAFRHEAKTLGLEFQPRPPYYVLRTPTLECERMLELLEEAEEIFGTEFDPLPEPSLDPTSNSAGTHHAIDLDDGPTDVATASSHAVVFRFRSRDPYRHRHTMEAIVRKHVEANPFSMVEIQIECDAEYPLDVHDGLRRSAERPVNLYLDRFYEFTTARGAGSTRIVTLLPHAATTRIDPAWIDAVESEGDVVRL